MRQSAIECYLEEHRALRKEITSQQETMRNFTIVYVTALASIASVALSISDKSEILLVIPFLSLLMGLVVFFHSRRVSQIGVYMRDELRPRLVAITADQSVMGWEKFVRDEEERRGRIRKWFSITGLHLVTFFLPSLLALIFSSPEVLSFKSNWLAAIWFLGAAFTIILIFIFVSERNYWFGFKETKGPKSPK